MEDNTKITLKNAKVVFVSLEDEGFGRSITVDATSKDVRDAITKWVKDNNIGKGDRAGIPNFKDHEQTTQYQFKMNDNTRFAGINGLSEKDLGFGAQVSLTANSFQYDNKFGKGTGSSLCAVVVEARSPTSADADLAELLGSLPTDSPPKISGYEKAKAQFGKPDVAIEDISDEPISLQDIPF